MKKYIFFIFCFAFFLFLRIEQVEADEPHKVLELLFNEGSGSVIFDYSGYGNNGIVQGADWVQLPTGKWILDFNGLGDTLSCEYSSSLDISGTDAKLTLEVWLNISEDKSTMVLGTGSGGSRGGYANYYHQPKGDINGYIEGIGQQGDSTYGWKSNTYTVNSPGVGVWRHIVYTYDGTRGRIYMDGQLENEGVEWTGGIFASQQSRPFKVFSSFPGMIGTIRVYDEALSYDQIENMYLSERENYYEIPSELTIYNYPAITDDRVLPKTILSEDYISSTINIKASPGEFEPASFVIYSPNELSSVQVQVSDLVNGRRVIPKEAVDIRTVKRWYQSGEGISQVNRKILVPELLLKDDSLVKVEDRENYLKLTSGNYIWISSKEVMEGLEAIVSVADMPVQDSSVFQPFNISSETNKQIWITVEVPESVEPGNYYGELTITAPGVSKKINLNLEVLDIDLENPLLIYSLYYAGRLSSGWPDGSISSYHKSEAQLEAEFENMLNHGVSNPTSYQPFNDLLDDYLEIKNRMGLGNSNFYYHGIITGNSSDPTKLENLKNRVASAVELVSNYGVTDLFVYGVDEAIGDELASERLAWEKVHEAGAKIFVAGYTAAWHPPGNFALVGDIQDLLVCAGQPLAEEAANWHSEGHQIFSYANPQVGEERPEKYRRNYGLLLWQKDYDGAMDWTYHSSFNNVWNDFDHEKFRDHNFTYPTINGVIDTIQWEGFREGVDDVRYLTTLLNLIDEKRGVINVSSAENWVYNLKQMDLEEQDLDNIRAQIVFYILDLNTNAPILTSIGDKTVNWGETLSFQVTATDPDGDILSYSASNIPQGASFAETIFTWTPTNEQSGTYSNVCFQVSDGSLTDQECITITVQDYTESCAATGLKTPVITPSSPYNNETFTISCGVTHSNFDCINAKVDETQCTFSNWSSTNAIFTCPVQTVGTHTTYCYTSTGTTQNCCSKETINNVTVLQQQQQEQEQGGGQEQEEEEEISEKPVSEMTIAELEAKIAEIIALIAQLQAELAQLRGWNIPQSFSFSNHLYWGDKNTEVTYLQEFLRAQGATIYPEGLVTGYFGPLTYQAVVRFQLKHSIIYSNQDPGAGHVGPKTRGKINALLGNSL